MIQALLVVATLVAMAGQFADAYTTNENLKKGFKESNKLAFIQWLLKHPVANLIVKAASGAIPSMIPFIGSHIATDPSTILGLQFGGLIGATAFAEEGWRWAYHNHKIGKK